MAFKVDFLLVQVREPNVLSLCWTIISFYSLCVCVCVCVCAQLLSCSVLSDSLDPMDLKLPGISVHGIFQTRILEWVAMPSSRGSSQPRDETHISSIGRWILYHWANWEASVCSTSPQNLTAFSAYLYWLISSASKRSQTLINSILFLG